jgi:hypothetical protein
MDQGPFWTANISLTPLKYFMPFNCEASVHNSPIENPLLRKLNTMSVSEDMENCVLIPSVYISTPNSITQ